MEDVNWSCDWNGSCEWEVWMGGVNGRCACEALIGVHVRCELEV